MTLEVLNIWGGRLSTELLDHLAQQASSIDVFCFQEVFHHGSTMMERQLPSDMEIFDKIRTLLPDHIGYFNQAQKDQEGLTIFIKSSYPVLKQGDIVVFRRRNALVGIDPRTLPRNIQYVEFELAGKNITIVNFHGLWNDLRKADSPSRIRQSMKIKKFLDTCPGEIVLCGDFNLKPDTRSIGLLEVGMRNLIKQYSISSTRTKLYDKDELFADYVLVSAGIDVKDFRVLDAVVSDHAPLYLEFT